jgi:hypothetical protein
MNPILPRCQMANTRWILSFLVTRSGRDTLRPLRSSLGSRSSSLTERTTGLSSWRASSFRRTTVVMMWT